MTAYLPMLLAATVASIVLGVCLAVRDLMPRVSRVFQPKKRRADDECGPTLVEAYVQARKPVSWLGSLDRAFGQLVNRTLLGLSAAEAFGFLALTGVLAASVIWFWRGDLWLSGLGLVIGVAVPLLFFLMFRNRWRQKLQDLLPDSFFLIARSLRAGLSLEQALELVGNQGPAPLAEEYRRVSDQVRLGLPIPAALQNMARRVKLSDFSIFLWVIEMNRRVGGNLTALLDRLAIGTRGRNQYRGQFRAATALGRATAVLISLGTPVLLTIYWILQPDFLYRFATSPSGITALAVAGVLEVVGIVWIFRLLRIDYRASTPKAPLPLRERGWGEGFWAAHYPSPPALLPQGERGERGKTLSTKGWA